jgi:hypothetical protein
MWGRMPLVVRLMSMALVLMLSFGAIACGSDDEDDEPPTAANAETCEELADAFVGTMQGVLDAVSELSMEDIMAEEEPEVLGDFEQDLEDAEAKSEELDCSDDEMAELLNDRVDDLTADGPVAELVLQMLQEEGFGIE